ncbi:MAG TPA: RNA polymerase sigma factor RpoD/SigA [Candidatus Cloacimonas acidaminovorans]|jgi:RNA polymerase primary sigma factor|nr:RNA polymerase sigma factor RpoD/SigA [Candidatus Cloacimonas acidaminovorans]HRS60476.1 RNA polymerase sigma factor RpoD/SigA [Candidatus Cloacimonas sp.]MDD5407756.1 RNA polymerase sigma factor RpoD/SigA [Candidatus Cloacimonas acidaminovorans]MDY0217777.1 RNA polymerase sigma factor RpoD/SigA [Candidatus Cloacimonas acidaminovorans]HOE54905.1 RNA polymerase sigma factor RpoD/SigA [Candidatus Cloacimonas acidaminovorans]
MSNKESVFADKALQNYLNEISKFKTLSREEEHDLAIKAKNGDVDAMNKLIQANLKFVVKIASRYQNRGLSLSELISEGNIGLIKAIEKFDPDKDIKLISYAIWWIKQRIMLAVSEKSSLIRVPMGKSSAAHRVKLTQDRYFTETGKIATPDELSEKMNIAEKTIAQLQNKLPETSSFDDIITTSDSQDFTAKDLLEDKDTLDPQSLYYQERMQEKIQNAISKLDAREADIIRNYFGLNESHESRNFAQIAEKLGLSRERVRQIQKEALKKIMREIKPEEDEFVDRFLEKYHY